MCQGEYGRIEIDRFCKASQIGRLSPYLCQVIPEAVLENSNDGKCHQHLSLFNANRLCLGVQGP